MDIALFFSILALTCSIIIPIVVASHTLKLLNDALTDIIEYLKKCTEELEDDTNKHKK